MKKKFFRKSVRTGSFSTKKAQVYVPSEVYELIKAKAESIGMPMSRLVCYAVDNELDAASPFNYPAEFPDTPFLEGAFASEAGKILSFIQKYGPHGLDSLLLSRREIGILDRNALLHGARELLHSELCEMVSPVWSNFTFPKNYKVMAFKLTEEDRKRKRIAELELEMAKLKGGPLNEQE